ncbi:MAG: hypothetical protein KIT84_03640 [Labilithrix sp.]|nr:hypothetical protein [Labilithrix sp.]MCW5810076.1 hypothetical protein [Labilithrix sp.]
MTDRSDRRFVRRLPYAATLALAPVAALAYIGCGDDDAPSGARVNLDPGGTWGAEVTVTVVGRGRVHSGTRGIDCPTGACFAKYVFPDNAADGATGGIQLNATPTAGVKFLGWSFEPTNLGARGRGPEGCNPVTRLATVPAVSTSDPQITLPFGETDGTSPPGQEANCGAFRRVPLAYKVTATFEAELPTFDAGFDAGADEVFYEAPDLTATNARGLGITSNNGLYWAYSLGASSVIAYGASPNSAIGPATALKVATVTTLGSFRVHPRGVVYTDGNNVYAIRATTPTQPVLVGDLGTIGQCRGFAIDTSSNVYCRTATSIVRWLSVGTVYAAPTVLYGSNLPGGNEIMVESALGPIWIDTGAGASSTGIASLPLTDPDGGAASPTPIITGRTSMTNVRSSSLGFAWSELGDGVFTTTSKTAGATVTESTVTTGTLSSLAQDQNSSTSWIAAGLNGIFLVSLGTGTTFRSGNQFNGAASTSSYVFWTTTTDAAIHRASRF